MGRFGHSKVFLAWGIPSPNYIKSSGSHITAVQMHTWKDNHLVRYLSQGDKVVLPPHEWFSLIQKVHLELKHFGIKRTYSLLALHYHWRGMYAQV